MAAGNEWNVETKPMEGECTYEPENSSATDGCNPTHIVEQTPHHTLVKISTEWS